MQIDQLQPSEALRIFRYSDIDHFRQGLSSVDVDITPLSVEAFSPMQAIVPLPDSDIVIMRSFPRVVDASMREGKMMILLPLEAMDATTINGVDVPANSLALVNGKTGYKAIEREAKLTAAIQLHPPVQDRGWPIAENSFARVDMSPEALGRLQRMISYMIGFASMDGAQWSAHRLGHSIQSTLLALLDSAVHGAEVNVFERSAAYRRQFTIARRVDEILAANPSTPIYSEVLSREIGVSVRTLHNAIVRMRGISLHQYLRLRRLWLVRQRLVSGDPLLNVKTCAMSFGFWHLGEFSSAYAQVFGELPSHTLARARGR